MILEFGDQEGFESTELWGLGLCWGLVAGVCLEAPRQECQLAQQKLFSFPFARRSGASKGLCAADSLQA